MRCVAFTMSNPLSWMSTDLADVLPLRGNGIRVVEVKADRSSLAPACGHQGASM